MSNRRTEIAIGGFLILLVFSLIGWNLALYYNFPIIPTIGILIGTFGFYMLGIIMTTDDQ